MHPISKPRNPFRRTPIVAAAWLLVTASSHADLAPFNDDFEGYPEVAPGLLLGGDWLVFANVFSDTGGYLYGYGPFAAPNSGGGFCNIAIEQGGPDQGAQVLTVYSDYNNAGMAGGAQVVEANVFQEFTIGAADVGSTWTFQFDVKIGNLTSPSTNRAFIKVLDPASGYSTTLFETFDVSTLPDENWATESLQAIIGDWEGQLLQIGFMATATNYEASGAFYDNISFSSPDFVPPAGPRILSAGFDGDGIYQVTFETKSGYDYSFWKASDPAGPYEFLEGDYPGDDFEATFYDFDASGTKSFYRVGETPVE